MIRSMTGFGRALVETPEKKITIEIKSLNAKQLDVSVRMPSIYNEKEPEIRNIIGNKLERGKIFVNFLVEYTGAKAPYALNTNLARAYHEQITNLEHYLNLPKHNYYTQVLMRMPDVLKSGENYINPEEWNVIKKGLFSAADDLTKFREQEGNAMAVDIEKRVKLINNLVEEIVPFEEDRIKRIRQKIEKELAELKDSITIDNDRLEQELIFYLEKLDITEEKVRLNTHCIYFLETMQNTDNVGKKLGFISQEIGREINTIGSKANCATIQKLVVNMKDELEKVKEQLMNVL